MARTRIRGNRYHRVVYQTTRRMQHASGGTETRVCMRPCVSCMFPSCCCCYCCLLLAQSCPIMGSLWELLNKSWCRWKVYLLHKFTTSKSAALPSVHAAAATTFLSVVERGEAISQRQNQLCSDKTASWSCICGNKYWLREKKIKKKPTRFRYHRPLFTELCKT